MISVIRVRRKNTIQGKANFFLGAFFWQTLKAQLGAKTPKARGFVIFS